MVEFIYTRIILILAMIGLASMGITGGMSIFQGQPLAGLIALLIAVGIGYFWYKDWNLLGECSSCLESVSKYNVTARPGQAWQNNPIIEHLIVKEKRMQPFQSEKYGDPNQTAWLNDAILKKKELLSHFPPEQQTWMEIINRPKIPQASTPRRWGRSCWKFLHCIVLAYPVIPNADEQKVMYNYFHALKDILPCSTCRVDFSRMLTEDPIERHLHSREALSRWLVEKHNVVNQKTGKPIVKYEDHIVSFVTRDDIDTPIPLFKNEGSLIGADVQPLVVKSSAPLKRNTNWYVIVIALLSVSAFGGLLYYMSQKRIK